MLRSRSRGRVGSVTTGAGPHGCVRMPQATRVPESEPSPPLWTITVLPSTPHTWSSVPMVKPVSPSEFWPPATMPGFVLMGLAVVRPAVVPQRP